MNNSPPATGDRWLRIARLALTAAMAISIVAAAALVVAIPVIARQHSGSAVRVFDSGDFGWVAALFLLYAGIALLAFFFLRHLRRIVDTVAGGDPFLPVNATRLRHMGWLSLAMQALAIPLAPLAIWFDAAPFKPNVHHGNDGISFGLLALALILFVLARVFRVGADMRADLEGTV